MRWPPHKAWTSLTSRKGYKHFEVKQYGGKKDKRWVELVAILNKNIYIRVNCIELFSSKKWESGWKQLSKDEAEKVQKAITEENTNGGNTTEEL